MRIDFSIHPSKALRKRFLVDEKDRPFKRWCRLQQAIYRESNGWPCGRGGGDCREIGSYLTKEDAEQGRNFLTSEIFEAAKHRLIDREAGDAIGRDRLLANMLSSQPLCFNLFIPQMLDLQMASSIWSAILPEHVSRVLDIKIEHSPRRGDAVNHTGDNSAFDAFVEYAHRDTSVGIIGIETKYTDKFSNPSGEPTDRLEHLAATTGLYTTDGWKRLRDMPTQQLWRTHLLAETMRDDRRQHVTYMVLHAAGDVECTDVLPDYEAALTPEAVSEGRFLSMTLEDFVAAARPVVEGGHLEWLDRFHARYLDWAYEPSPA